MDIPDREHYTRRPQVEDLNEMFKRAALSALSALWGPVGETGWRLIPDRRNVESRSTYEQIAE